MKTLRAAIVLLMSTVSGTEATPLTASMALHEAERLCALPAGAEFVQWGVISSDEATNPSPSAQVRRYWVVHGRFNFPGSKRVADVFLPVPKLGRLPKGCSIIPAPEINGMDGR